MNIIGMKNSIGDDKCHQNKQYFNKNNLETIKIY